MEVLIIVVLSLLNGVFSMSEIALVSARKFKLENAAKRGNKGAKKALELAESPNKFLSTVQIGITLIGLLTGIYSGKNITSDVKAWLLNIPALAPYAEGLSVTCVLIFITFLSLVLGELLPKRIGMSFPETVASAVARPMHYVSLITAPFVWLLTHTSDLLLRLMGIRSETDSIVTEEEIKSIVQESADSGQIDEIEQDIVERVFALGDRQVDALMTHRSDIVWLDVADSLEDIRDRVRKERYSVYPVCDGDLDNFKGVVYINDLFIHSGPDFKLIDKLKQPLFVPDTSTAYQLLESFRKSRQHYAVLIDEYGTLQGVITLDDIVDALVGDVSAEHHDEYQITEVDPNTWRVDGQYAMHEFLQYLEIEHYDHSNNDFNTIGGLFIHELNRLPKQGDKVTLGDFTLTVLKMDGHRVDEIEVKK
jgi:putative hemolysin